ncbi:TRAP transporter small permease subunit [uncultured Desulfovibrio sp.]|uniref:TRAP transporter small permease subunit n=1 Tax=uncultured Desulfovibrio sp. TaxID=167968 RepID=UPI0003B78551|nr:TRAP transporter small permease [uncultured Desulfovibrio sp.]
MTLIDSLNRPLQVLIKLSHMISSFVLYPAMVTVITVDVTGRFLFNSPLSWGTEGSGLIQIMAIFLVCASVESTDAHIQLDILYAKFSARGKCLVKLLTCVTAGIWAGMLTSRSFSEIFVSMDMLESGMDVTIPFWPIRMVMTFAFALLGLQLLMNFSINFAKLLRGGEEHA